jgi:hypothetical protein
MDLNRVAAMKTLPRTSARTVIVDTSHALEAYGDPWFETDRLDRSRSNLLFTPSWGPHVGCIYLVDYWAILAGAYIPSPEISYSASKQSKLREAYPDHPLHVVVATNGLIGNGARRMVADEPAMQLVPSIESGAELAAAVARLAGMTG